MIGGGGGGGGGGGLSVRKSDSYLLESRKTGFLSSGTARARISGG